MGNKKSPPKPTSSTTRPLEVTVILPNSEFSGPAAHTTAPTPRVFDRPHNFSNRAHHQRFTATLALPAPPTFASLRQTLASSFPVQLPKSFVIIGGSVTVRFDDWSTAAMSAGEFDGLSPERMARVTGLKVRVDPGNRGAPAVKGQWAEFVEREEEAVEVPGIEWEWEKEKVARKKRLGDEIAQMFEGAPMDEVVETMENVRKMGIAQEEVDRILEAVKSVRK